MGVTVTTASHRIPIAENLAHWLLLAQGRNADDAQILQELDEDPTYR
jgi:hypothetical protein